MTTLNLPAAGTSSGPLRPLAPRLGAAALAVCLLLAGPQPVRAGEPIGEYVVKAAFLVNFGSFVRWPVSAFPGAPSPFGVCIIGEDPFGDAFRQFAQQQVAGRPLAVATIESAAEALGKCQILFVAQSEEPRLSQILRELWGAAVLTVGDLDDFTRAGGMIQFLVREGKVRFLINREAAEAAGLKIDARLLRLAEPGRPPSLTGAW